MKRSHSPLKWVLWLPWQLLIMLAWILSFGALNLSAIRGRNTSNAFSEVWRFFRAFLISKEPWPIILPVKVAIPWWKFDKWSGAPQGRWLSALIFAGGGMSFVYAFVCPYSLHLLHHDIGAWLPYLEIVVPVAWLVSALRLVSRPSWIRDNRAFTPPFAGVKLITLPEAAKGWFLLACVGLGIVLVNYFAVRMNELNGAFMNSITSRDAAAFWNVLKDFAYVLASYTVLGPFYAYGQKLITLEWTKFVTRYMLQLYKKDRNYYPVSLLRHPDNPNERIQQDVPLMCQAALRFGFTIVDSLITFFLFGGILWGAESGLNYHVPFLGHVLVVNHLVLWILVAYALLGTNGVVRVGKRLIGLQADQKRLGADFRVGMVMFEKYAEPIAAYHGEEREYTHLWRRFMLALRNNYAIVKWQRNLGFFTSGYSQISVLLPYAVLAPFYFTKQIAFGTITQASGAFGQILASASIFVSEFDSLTSLLASVERVSELRVALEELAADNHDGQPLIRREDGGLLSIEHVSLFTPDRSRLLVHDLNLTMTDDMSVLIKGPSGGGKTSLLRCVAGLPLWDRGEGVIRMSTAPGHYLMLTQLAYLPGGISLREQLTYPAAEGVTDAELLAVLDRTNLGHLSEQVGGLDATPNWDKLSGGERQRLVVARALVNRVRLVIADEATSGLDIENEELLYRAMKSAGLSLLSVGHRPSLLQFHDHVIELAGDGTGAWKILPACEMVWKAATPNTPDMVLATPDVLLVTPGNLAEAALAAN